MAAGLDFLLARRHEKSRASSRLDLGLSPASLQTVSGVPANRPRTERRISQLREILRPLDDSVRHRRQLWCFQPGGGSLRRYSHCRRRLPDCCPAATVANEPQWLRQEYSNRGSMRHRYYGQYRYAEFRCLLSWIFSSESGAAKKRTDKDFGCDN